MKYLKYLFNFKKPDMSKQDLILEKRKEEIERLLKYCKSRYETFKFLIEKPLDGWTTTTNISTADDAFIIFERLILNLFNLSFLIYEKERSWTIEDSMNRIKELHNTEIYNMFNELIDLYKKWDSNKEKDKIIINKKDIIINKIINNILIELNDLYRNIKKSKLMTPLDVYRKRSFIQTMTGFAIIIIISYSIWWVKDYHTPPEININIAKIEEKENKIEKNITLIQINDIYNITIALFKYYKKYKRFPKSSSVKYGWDGLYSEYGESRIDWIKGLAPDFITELPRDPRNHSDLSRQYLYKSNGEDFKIISHQPLGETMQIVKEEYTELCDPARPGISFGIWTRKAEGW